MPSICSRTDTPTSSGPRGKKFLYRRFRELLVSISQEPMDRQKVLLGCAERVEGPHHQVDDIPGHGHPGLTLTGRTSPRCPCCAGSEHHRDRASFVMTSCS